LSPSVGTFVGSVVGSSTSGALAIVITRLAPGVTSEEAALLCPILFHEVGFLISWISFSYCYRC